jgi:hypothetical protein
MIADFYCEHNFFTIPADQYLLVKKEKHIFKFYFAFGGFTFAMLLLHYQKV